MKKKRRKKKEEKINEKLDEINNMDNIEKLDEEYKVLIFKYNLYDKLEEDHEKIKIIYRNINELQKQDKDKAININEFNERGKKICKIIDTFRDIKLNNINELIK